MHFSVDGPQAIPLWINGHPCLKVTKDFFDVVNGQTGTAVRRVPLCGEEEAFEAVAAAKSAQDAWGEAGMLARRGHIEALAGALENYAAHFSGLLDEETACGMVCAEAEVAASLAVLARGEVGQGGIVGVVTDASRPLAGVLSVAIPALLGGATVVVKPSPKATGPAYALAELTRRAGWPDGVFNLLTGDVAAIEGLCRAGLDRLVCQGEDAFAERVAAMAGERRLPFERGQGKA